jgi:hypothetical protein
MNFYIATLASCFAFAACAHYPDVRPGAKGQNYVEVTGQDEDEVSRDAISQANDYCKDVHKKSAGIVSEDKKYVGDMDEKSYKNAKRATAVAKTIGSAGVLLGGENERNAGGIATIGGVAADSAIGSGYKVTIKFNCI